MRGVAAAMLIAEILPCRSRTRARRSPRRGRRHRHSRARQMRRAPALGLLRAARKKARHKKLRKAGAEEDDRRALRLLEPGTRQLVTLLTATPSSGRMLNSSYAKSAGAANRPRMPSTTIAPASTFPGRRGLDHPPRLLLGRQAPLRGKLINQVRQILTQPSKQFIPAQSGLLAQRVERIAAERHPLGQPSRAAASPAVLKPALYLPGAVRK